MIAVEAIKRKLGSLGRTDFDTRGPGDLTWPVERVAVFIDDCLIYGCPKHSKKTNDTWKRRARVNRRRADKLDKDLLKKEWVVFRFWEHEAVESLDRVAEEIVQAFAEMRDSGTTPVSLIAQAANLDGSARVGDDNWIRLLHWLSKAEKNFRRADLYLVLVDREGWSPETFKSAWRTALHHRIILSNNSGCHPGPMLPLVLKDLGIKKKEEARRA